MRPLEVGSMNWKDASDGARTGGTWCVFVTSWLRSLHVRVLRFVQQNLSGATCPYDRTERTGRLTHLVEMLAKGPCERYAVAGGYVLYYRSFTRTFRQRPRHRGTNEKLPTTEIDHAHGIGVD